MRSLERGLKSPTMHKLTELCEVMEVHPLTLLMLANAGDSTRKVEQLLAQVRRGSGRNATTRRRVPGRLRQQP